MSDSNKRSKPNKKKTSWPFQLLIELPSALIVLCVTLIIGTLFTAYGRTTLSNVLIDYIKLPNGYTLQAKNLTSPSIGEWHFEMLTVLHNNKPLLNTHNGIIDWAPLKILQGRIVMSQLIASQVIWHPTLDFSKKKGVAHQKSSKKPLHDFHNPLEALDQAIDEALKKFAIQFMPMTISQFAIDELKLKHKQNTLSIQTNGHVNIGLNKKAIQASIFTSITSSLWREPLTIHIETYMNHKRDLFLSLNTEFNHQHKTKTVPINTTLHASMALTERPFHIRLKPSLLHIGQQNFGLHGSATLQSTGIDLDSLTLTAFNGTTTLQGRLRNQQLALQGSISAINPKTLVPETIDLTTNGQFTLTGALDNPKVQGSLTSSGTLFYEKTNINTNFSASNQALHITDGFAELGKASAAFLGDFEYASKKLELLATPKNLHLAQIAQFNIPLSPDLDLLIKQATTKIQYTMPKNNQLAQLIIDAQGDFNGHIFSIPSDISGGFTLDLDQMRFNQATAIINGTPAQVNGSINWRQNSINLHLLADNVSPKTLSWLPFKIPTALDSQLHTDLTIDGKLKKPTFHLQASGPLHYEKLSLLSNCKLTTDLQKLLLHYCHLFEATAHQKNTLQEKIVTNSGTIQFQPLEIKLLHQFFLLPVNAVSKALPMTQTMRHELELDGQIQGVIHSHFSSSSTVGHHKKLQLQAFDADLGLYGQAWLKPLYAGLRATINRRQNGLAIDIQSLGLNYGEKSHTTLTSQITPNKIKLQSNGFIASTDLKNLPFRNIGHLTQWPAKLTFDSHIFGDLYSPQAEGMAEYIANIEQVNTLGKNVKIPLKFLTSFKKNAHQPLALQAQVFKEKNQQSKFTLTTNALEYLISTIHPEKKPQPFKIKSQGSLNLANLNLLLNPVFHQIQGQVHWRFNWDNHLQNQSPFTGNIDILDGSYQHLTLGTQLQDIKLQMLLSNNGIRIKQAQATDSSTGQYSMAGFLKLQDLRPTTTNQPATLKNASPTNLKLQLKQVQLVDRPDIETLASGHLHLLNLDNGLTINGAIALQPLEFQLDRTRADQIDEIEITRYNPRFKTKATQSKKRVPINLNIDLNAKQQAYLRGKGINTELEGQVAIRGTTQSPKINGYFKTLRGDADILGKRFIINNGELRFDGSRGLIDLQATHSKTNQDFIAKVTGSLDNLDVRLESNPRLPDDETLSQLLFGKALNDISAIQALRIASAVRSFSAGGSGLDPLATTRNLLGVDQVTLDSDNNENGQENYKLGVGKYVSDKVYVEIQRSTDPTEPWQGKVQIEITPNISLDTSAQSNNGFSGLDIIWKRDY